MHNIFHMILSVPNTYKHYFITVEIRILASWELWMNSFTKNEKINRTHNTTHVEMMQQFT